MRVRGPLLAALVLGPALALAQPAEGPRVGGSVKALGIASHTADGRREPTQRLLNRLRLKLDFAPAPHWALHLENDTEWDLRNAASNGTGSGSGRWRNRVFRATAGLSLRDTDLLLGRQRIALGTGRLWSTVDLLNPLNPLLVERDEYVGVDALRIDQRFGDLSGLTLVGARVPGGGAPRWVLRGRTNLGGADLGATLARYGDDQLASVDLATQWQGSGLRAEFTGVRTRLPAGVSGTRGPARSATGARQPAGAGMRVRRQHAAALLGADYAFANTLTVSIEAYLSTQDPAQRRLQLAADPWRARLQPAGTRYAGLIASYDLTPLLKVTLIQLVQLRDRSRFGAVSLAYSLDDNLVLQGGLQVFGGAPDSEFGRGRTLGWAQLQWFF